MADERTEALREAARHRGYKLVASRRRTPGVGDYGRFGLTDAGGKKLFGFSDDGLTASADEIAAYLRRDMADWATSAKTTPARPQPKSETPAVAPEPTPKAGNRRKATKRSSPPEPETKPVPKPAPEPEPEPVATPPPLRLRKARSDDADAIAALIGATPQALAARLVEAVRGKSSVIVADRGGVIGCVAWHVLPTLQKGSIGRVSLVFVAEEERRRGIGRSLVGAARDALSKAGCELIEVMSDIEIRNAHGFFRALGFRQASYRFVTD